MNSSALTSCGTESHSVSTLSLSLNTLTILCVAPIMVASWLQQLWSSLPPTPGNSRRKNLPPLSPSLPSFFFSKHLFQFGGYPFIASLWKQRQICGCVSLLSFIKVHIVLPIYFYHLIIYPEDHSYKRSSSLLFRAA